MDINTAKRIFVKHFDKPDKVLLKLSEDLMAIVEIEGVKYVTYVLQNRVTVTKDKVKRKLAIKEVLIGRYDKYKIKQLERMNITIYEYFESVECHKVGYIGGILYEPSKVNDMREISNRFPQKNILLNMNKKPNMS